MTTVVLAGNTITQQRKGETLYGENVAGVSGNTHRHAAIHADKHAHTEQQCGQFQTREHKHTPWLDGLVRRWKDGCGKSCGEVNEGYIPVGQATVFAVVIDKCLFVTCGGQAQKATSVIFNVQPC